MAHFLTIGLCVFYFQYYGGRAFLRLISAVLLVGGVASILYTVALPRMAIHDCCGLEGSWKGIYGHKNDLGRVAVIAIICALYAPASRSYPNVSKCASLSIYGLLLLLSQSTTNIFTCLLILGFAPFLNILTKSRMEAWIKVSVILFAASVIVFAVTYGMGMLLEAAGKDATFSGRTTLWAALSEILAQKFTYLGAGYGAFFTEGGGANDLSAALRYWFKVPVHAHNGYWDTRVNLGMPGMAILILLMLGYLARSVRKLVTQSDPFYSATFCYFLLFAINNFTESETFQNGDYPWLTFLVLYMALGRRSTVQSGEQNRLPLGLPHTKSERLSAPQRIFGASVRRN